MRALPVLALASALLAAPAPASAAKVAAGPAGEAAGTLAPLEALVALQLDKGESYRVVPLSPTLFYVQFASGEVRQAVFEGIRRDRLAALASPLTLTLPRPLLVEAYAGAATLGGLAAAFREDLAKAGFLAPAQGGFERVLLTMIQPGDSGALFDFSFSESVQAPTERREKLDRLEGDTAAETTSLKFLEREHPAVQRFETWRFDDMPDLMDEAARRDAEEDRRRRVRRARLAGEVIRALYWVDPAYEPAVVGWIESDLAQPEVNLLAQLLQIAGYREMSPEVLVRESAPHLFDSSVLVARLYQNLERVTVKGKRRGHRRLDPAQFPDPAVQERAEAFYGRLFLGDGGGEVRPELRPEVLEFLRERSANVQRLSSPFLARHVTRTPDGGP